MQDYATAKETLEPLLSADADPELKTSAESIMKMVEYATRPAAAPSELPRSRTDADRSAEPETSAPSQPAPPRLAKRPTLKIEGAQTIRGVLVSIECKAGKWTLGRQYQGRSVAFHGQRQGQVGVLQSGPQFEGKVNCGSVNKIAIIYFKPIAGKSSFAGDAVAVEFTRD